MSNGGRESSEQASENPALSAEKESCIPRFDALWFCYCEGTLCIAATLPALLSDSLPIAVDVEHGTL